MIEDLIKRSDAIKSLDNAWINGTSLLDANETIKQLNVIPSADRPQGEWIIEYNGNGWNDYWDYICPNCGKKYERADAVLYKANYCPNCGAKMK